MTRRWPARFLSLPVCLVFAACGIDRGGAPSADFTPVTASRGDNLVVGAIESLSASGMRISGQDIDTTGATFILNGAASDLSMFRVGYYTVARVNGPADAAAASEVRADLNVNAPVASYDATASRLIALGQTVRLNSDTQIDVSLLGLDLGDPQQVPAVSISGYTDAAGGVLATHLALGDGGDVRLTGFASDVMVAQLAFDVGDQLVDYSASLVVDLASGAPSDGARVRVMGAAPLAGQALVAASVETAPILPPDLIVGAHVSLSGFVTGFGSGDDFSIAFVGASLAPTVAITNGSVADVAVDRLVSIGGILQDDGRILIDTLEFLD